MNKNRFSFQKGVGADCLYLDCEKAWTPNKKTKSKTKQLTIQ